MREGGEALPREHLVVVIPGIGGTVLAPPGRLDSPVWSAGFRDIGSLLLRPHELSLAEHKVLTPVGLIRTHKAFGLFTAVRGYGGLLDRLAALPEVVLDDGTGRANLDANVVAVGYDFRLGVISAAEHLDRQLAPRLQRLWPGRQDQAGRLLFVAHSMGGLVARYWLAQDENWRSCRGLLTLGTPHRGAPKALDVLANGIAVKGNHLIKGGVRELAREWPGVYDLLPRYGAIRDDTPAAPVSTPLAQGNGEPPPQARWLRPTQLPLPWLTGPAARAQRMHGQIETAWTGMPRSGPRVEPRIGYGHSTLRGCVWDGRRVRVTTGTEGLRSSAGWDDDQGDGTVPAVSGLPVEMTTEPPLGMRVPARHGPIVDLDQVSGWVESAEGRPPPTAIHGRERPVVLGVDLEEVTLAGESTPITATVQGIPGSPATSPVVAVAAGTDPARTVAARSRLSWDGARGGFVGELPGLNPGLFEVSVYAEAVPAAGDLLTQASLEAIEGDHVD
ncbi:MAG: esterase/lipase family protein [Dermatophilaceae bacterium]